jgi:TonB family protein
MRQNLLTKCFGAVLLLFFTAAAMAWPPPAVAQSNGPMRSGLQLNAKILTPTKGVEFQKYTDQLVARMKRNWFAVMPEQAMLGEKGTVTLAFRVQRDGTIFIDDPKIESSSNNKKLDKAALDAVRNSVPFDPLPAPFHEPSIKLQCEFVYDINPPRESPRSHQYDPNPDGTPRLVPLAQPDP